MKAMFESKKTTLLFYAFIFLFTLHITPAIYVNTNFLGQFLPAGYISLAYIIASIATVLIILGLRPHLKRFGNYKVFITSLVIEVIALFLLILTNSFIPALISFITLMVVYSTAFINLDIFLEKSTHNESTGKTRGRYLTAINAAFILGPFLSSLLLANGDFKQVYIFNLVLLFPVIFLASELFSKFEDSPYDKLRIVSAFRTIRKNTDVYSTIMADFVLRFFYAWMVIFTPVYLYQVQGFTLSEVSLILAIALVPFTLIQGTAGKYADKQYGEKEMMTIGFIVAAFFTGLMAFVTSSNLSVWIAILFMTRVGACMVEIMTETHLFKRIDGGDLNTISLFRISTPIAYILGASLGTFFLFIVDFNMLFLILGGIVLYGIRYSLAITDTK